VFRHRGAVAADHRSGDGAGLLLPLPDALVPEPGLGIAMVFFRGADGRRMVEEACKAEGIAVRSWRPVPIDLDALGPSGPRLRADNRTGAPRTAGGRFRGRRGGCIPRPQSAWTAAKPLRRSLSFRTVVYKALCAADQLAPFYADLRDPSFEVPFGIFHQRFSTNTEPSWSGRSRSAPLSQREINAIRGNVNWMRARALTLVSTGPCSKEASSDSGMLDNALELLVRGGRDARHALTMLIPPAWQGDAELDPEVRDFHRFHAGWSSRGTARPGSSSPTGASSCRTRPKRSAASSLRRRRRPRLLCLEAGVFDVPGGKRVLAVDGSDGGDARRHPEGGLDEDDAIKRRLSDASP